MAKLAPVKEIYCSGSISWAICIPSISTGYQRPQGDVVQAQRQGEVGETAIASSHVGGRWELREGFCWSRTQQGEGERERHTELRDSNTNTPVVHRLQLHSQLPVQGLTPRHSPASAAEARKQRAGGRRRRKKQDEFLICSIDSFRHPSVTAKPQTKL